MKDFVRKTEARSRPVKPEKRALCVLHVLDHSVPLHSGYSFRTLAILREQRLLGWESFQLTGPKQGMVPGLREEIDGFEFNRTLPLGRWVTGFPIAKQLLSIQGLTSSLRELVNRVRPDLIHAHSPVLNALPALKVGREFGLPVVYEIRAFWEDAAADHGTAREWGPRYRLSRALETRAAYRADAVTTICDGLRNDLIGRGLPSEKVTVIPNAVDTQRFAKSMGPDLGLQRKFGLQTGYTLGFAGSFYAYEGLDLLIKAMPRIVNAVPAARLLLVGGGPRESNLKELISQLGLDRVVCVAGRVTHDEIARYYSVMDLMAYPRISRRLTELVTPLKPLEAMAAEKIVLASDVGGHRELIVDGRNGFLFSAGSVEALANRVIEVFKNRDSWSAVIACAKNYVESERTWQGSVLRYREVYDRVIAHTGGRKDLSHGG